jgi:acetyl-CoA acetyltransferase
VLGERLDETWCQRATITDVEAACATGFVAFEQACLAIRAGDADVALAVGVDKTFLPDLSLLGPLFAGALDQLDFPATRRIYDDAARSIGVSFEPSPARLLTLDVAALLAQHALQQGTTTTTRLAELSAAAHANAAKNDKATKRGPSTAAEVSADKVALAPFTRSMCTGLADGAAAVVVVSAAWLRRQPTAVQARAVRVRSLLRRPGRRLRFDDDSVTLQAARALEKSDPGVLAGVSVVEVHDATAFATAAALQALSLTSLPLSAVNPSGGLIGKGHPLAATGLAMVREVVTQLRGEAGARQVVGATRGLVHNAGGFAGLDEAVVGVGIFERT